MVKLFIVGDFHGKVSSNLLSKIRREKPDFILSPGDFCGNEKLAKFYFKYLYGKLEEEIPKKIQKQSDVLYRQAFHAGISVIKELKSLKIPILAIHGNWDPTPYPFDLGSDIKESKTESLRKLEDNTFRLADFSLVEEKEFILVCGGSSTYPGIPSFEYFKKELREAENFKEKQELLIRFFKRRREYLRRSRIYKKLFLKAKKIANGRKIIFLTHNCPYKTKLDLVKSKHAHKRVKGKHVGSYLERKMIEQFQPNIVLCGHVHGSHGTDKIKKSLIYNIGSSLEGRFKILEI